MATTNTLRLEVGKKYRTRDGQIVEIDDHDDTPSNPFPFSGYVDGNYFSWKHDGTFFDARPNDMDLVEEIPDATPEYRYFRFDSQDRNIDGQDMRWRVAPGARPEACDTHEGVWRTSAHGDLESLETANGLIECRLDGTLRCQPESEPAAPTKTPEHRARIAKLAARIVLADGPILTVDELAGMTVGELVAQLGETEIYSI